MQSQQQEIEFYQLLERHNATINNLCLRYSNRDHFYFDELRQECILELWNEFKQQGHLQLRNPGSEKAWIEQIVFHAIARYLRIPSNKELPTLDATGTSPLSIPDNSQDSPQILLDIIERLNYKERALLQQLLDGDSYTTIAHQSRIPQGTARQRTARLIKKIKAIINPQQDKKTQQDE